MNIKRTGYAAMNEKEWQFETALSVERACDKFFDDCGKNGVPPTVAGLALELGTNVHTLKRWLEGDPNSWHTELSEDHRRRCAEAVGKAMMKIMKYAEEAAYNNSSAKGAIKILTDVFGVLPQKTTPEKLELVLPDSLKGLAE